MKRLLSSLCIAVLCMCVNAETFSELLTKAYQGDAVAQNNLGVRYEKGEGTKKDVAEANKWYLKAAEQGNKYAQLNLAINYRNGNGTTANNEKAFYWLKKAVEQGLWADRQYELAKAYYYGEGTAINKDKAFYWFKKAAEQGDISSQIWLGECYEKGEGTKKDVAEANKWYLKAAEQGNEHAQYSLAKFYQNTVADKEKAFYWYNKAAEQGLSEAQCALGHCYKRGEGTSKDFIEANKWYLKAAEQENKVGQYELANSYYNGNGIAVDKDKAFYWYKKAAVAFGYEKLGYPDAQNMLGICYEYGEGTNKDLTEANKWYLNAAERGNKFAQYNLAHNYYYGNGTAVDKDKAFYWYKKAAEQGYAKAQNSLGYCYETGEGTKKDLTEANKWYLKAAEQGNKYAQCNLANNYNLGKGSTVDKDKAFYWYKKSAEQGYAKALIMLGFCYLEGIGTKKDDNKAFEAIDKAIESSTGKKKCDYLDTKGEFYSIIGDSKNALNVYEQIVNIDAQFYPNYIAKNGETAFYKYVMQLKGGVDLDIPKTTEKRENTFVVIISNENYQTEAAVPYALNDGRSFAKYCELTLGIPKRNIKIVENATLNNIKYNLNWLKQISSVYGTNSKVIFYYAGHGIPNESNGSASLLPVDGYGNDVTTGYSLNDLYSQLSELPSKEVLAFLDACFSGTKREGGMMASARGIAIKVKATQPKGNLVVFSAAQGDETAYPYKDANHGMFTYFILKKLKDTKGDVTLQELTSYVTTEVKKNSLLLNGKLQEPTLYSSPNVSTNCMSWKIR